MRRIYLFVILLLMLTNPAWAQKKSSAPPVSNIENYYLIGNYYFLEEKYLEALPFFDTLRKYYPKVLEYKLKAGIAYLYKPAYVDTALALLKEVYEKKPKTEKILYWLGKAYCLNYDFDKGLACFNNILTEKKLSPAYRKEVELLIRQAQNAKQFVQKPVEVSIKNIGPPINTQWDEYSPIINSNASVMMFTYRGIASTGGKQNDFNEKDSLGTYFEDIMISYYKNGEWTVPQKLDSTINTHQHEATVQLSPDGQTMLYYKDTESNSGEIFVTSLEGNHWGIPEKLPICSPEWEGSAAISPDVKFIIFSSDRPGGLGGIDLYISRMDSMGFWGPAENLGATINTEFNEDGVFIHPDGKTIIFSSQGHNSMGGYDIFITQMKEDGSFSEPENLGYPINTPGDDIFFVVTADGRRAFFSSERKDGVGRKDIYEMDVSKVIRPRIVGLVKGIVTDDFKPISARILVKEVNSNDILLTVNSNAVTGEYQFNLPSGKNFHLTYMNEEGKIKERIVFFDTLSYYTEKKIDVDFSHDFIDIIGSARWASGFSSADVELMIIDCGDSSKKWIAVTDKQGNFKFQKLPYLECYEFVLYKKSNDILDDTLLIDGFVNIDGMPVMSIVINKINPEKNGKVKLKLWKLYQYKQLQAEKAKISLLENFDESEFIKKYGNYSRDGLSYKVQIGAYRQPNNFKYTSVKTIGKVSKELLDDGITRFYVGGDFKTYNLAKQFCDKVIKKGITDAFVLVTYQGKRTYIEELIRQGILPE